MTANFQMLGNAALMERPKVAFLSSRRVAPAAVMRCYDWATGMRGGGGTPGGSAGRLAPPGDGGHAGRVTLPLPLRSRARRSQSPPLLVSANGTEPGMYRNEINCEVTLDALFA